MRMFFLILAIIPFLSGHAIAGEEKCHYTLGLFKYMEPRKTMEAWTPVQKLLEETTGCDIQITITNAIRDVEKSSEYYDFIYGSAINVLKWNMLLGFEPIVRGSESYEGLIVVKKDDPIKDVRELDGQQVLVNNVNALGGAILPKVELERDFGIKIKLTATGTQDTVFLSVAKGLARVGCGVPLTFDVMAQAVKDHLRVLYRTKRKVLSLTIAASPKLDKAVVAKVQKALVDHPEVLTAIPMPDPVRTSITEYNSHAIYMDGQDWYEDYKKNPKNYLQRRHDTIQ